MTRLIKITVDKFITNWLPPHKRRPIRLQLFKALLLPFAVVADEYRAWRDTAITRIQVTGETVSLEWYLNHHFDPTLLRIEIETASTSGFPVGIDNPQENSFFINAGLFPTEPASYESIPLPGEDTVFGLYSFVVKVPAALTALQPDIIKIVNIYRAAGKLFKIILIP